MNTVLTELERHEGLCVLATNRPMDLDEAMHRRITLAIEFTKPDLLLRERIWRQMAPPKLELAKDVDFMALARKYELPGGFIKNAWLSALSIAVARDGVQCVVNHADLHAGASHQLRGRLAMSNFDRGVVPTRGLEDVQLPKEVKEKLKQIVNYSKAQATRRAIRRNSAQFCAIILTRVLLCRRCSSGSGASSSSTAKRRGSPPSFTASPAPARRWRPRRWASTSAVP